MRILVLTPQPLDPLHDGLNLRVFHLFRPLTSRHDVWVLYLTEDGIAEPSDKLARAGFAGLHGVRVRGENGRPFRHCRDFSPEAERAIADFLADRPTDAIVAESIYMVPYARNLLPRSLLLDLVDDTALLQWRSLWTERRWPDQARQLRTWYLWRRYERRNLSAFPHIMVTSVEDARAVARNATTATVTVLPNGVDTEVFSPLEVRSEAPELVFSGVMGFRPNEAAVEYFYTRIFPRVRAAVPEARFTVAGKGPTRRLHDLVGGDPAVQLTGHVEDIRPYIGRAAVYVAPMVSGAGIKNKILEAWAMARPVVATPIACRDLEGRAGRTHFVAASPSRFADLVVDLLKDRERGDEIGHRARQVVVERYQWSDRGERLVALLEAINNEQRAEIRSWPSVC